MSRNTYGHVLAVVFAIGCVSSSHAQSPSMASPVDTTNPIGGDYRWSDADVNWQPSYNGRWQRARAYRTFWETVNQANRAATEANRYQLASARAQYLLVVDQTRDQQRNADRQHREAGKRAAAERAATVYYTAYRLEGGDFDTATGGLNWPVALDGVEDAEDRDRVEALLLQLYEIGGEDSDALFTAPLMRSIERLRTRAIQRGDYDSAVKRFLRGVEYEARYGTARTNVADRLAVK